MKNIAQLALSHTFCFIVVLVVAGAAGLLRDWAVVFYPASRVSSGFVGALGAAIPAALYFSLLFGVIFIARQRILYPAALPVLVLLSVALSAAACLGIRRVEDLSPKLNIPAVEGNPGLLLAVSQGDPPLTAVLLQEKPEGARVLSLPGQPLYFEAVSSAYRNRPVQLPFRQIPVLPGVAADFGRSARALDAWFDAGLASYAMYAGSLSLFLVSLGCLVNISFWPLANLFFGVLAFRGALALETFLNAAKTRQLLASFAASIVPESLINPLVFTAAGILILLYSSLVYLARGRRSE